MDDLTKYNLEGKYEICITYKSNFNKIPFIKKYKFDVNLITYVDLMGRLYLADTVTLFNMLKKELNINERATIQLQSSYIGTLYDTSICIECIINKSYIRKLKIERILNEC